MQNKLTNRKEKFIVKSGRNHKILCFVQCTAVKSENSYMDDLKFCDEIMNSQLEPYLLLTP